MYDHAAKQVIISRLLKVVFTTGARNKATVQLELVGNRFSFELDPSAQSHEAIEEAVFELTKQIKASMKGI